jgi:hypothetical protein
MSKLKNKPLTKLLGPFFWVKWSETTRKQVFMLFFLHFGAIWAPPYEPKKVLKGPQVGRTYGPMSKLKNKPLTKLSADPNILTTFRVAQILKQELPQQYPPTVLLFFLCLLPFLLSLN